LVPLPSLLDLLLGAVVLGADVAVFLVADAGAAVATEPGAADLREASGSSALDMIIYVLLGESLLGLSKCLINILF